MKNVKKTQWLHQWLLFMTMIMEIKASLVCKLTNNLLNVMRIIWKRMKERMRAFSQFSRWHLNRIWMILFQYIPQSNDIVESFNESYGMYFQSTTRKKEANKRDNFPWKICNTKIRIRTPEKLYVQYFLSMCIRHQK